MNVEQRLALLRQRRSLLVFPIYAISALQGLHVVLVDDLEPTSTDFFLAVLFAVVLTVYCVTDSQLRGKPIPYFSRWLMFFTLPVSVPIYVLWSQGKNRILSAVLRILSVPGFFLLGAFLTEMIRTFIEPN